MNERIGNYIHYRYKNYQKYGTGVKSGESPQTINVMKQHENAMKHLLKSRSKASKATIKKNLEQQLNFFFGAEGNLESLGYTTQQQQEIRTEVESLCKMALSNLNPNFNLDAIDFNTLSVKDSLLSQLTPIVDNGYGILGKAGTYTWTDAIERRLAELQTRVTEINLESAMSSDIVAKVQELQKTYDNLRAEIDEAANKSNRTYKSSRRAFILSGEESLARRDFITSLNVAIGAVKDGYHNMLIGYLGEYVPVITQYVMNKYAAGKTGEIMAEFEKGLANVVGGQRSKKILDASKFFGGTRTTDELQVGNINSKMSYTQDKVDIILDIPGTSQKIKTSVKNYNLARVERGIHIHSGTSLLKMVQDYPTFINHYANVTAEHRAQDDTRPSSAEIAAAHRAMKLTIGAYSLVGGLLGKRKGDGSIAYGDKAEILLVNDNSSKRGFKVYFIDDLIKKIANNIDLLEIEGYDNPTWSNRWVKNGMESAAGKDVSAGYRRSMAVIAQMHRVKMRVTLKKEALT